MEPISPYRFALLATALVLLAAAGPAPAQTLFGTLSDFDVLNDTGQETHGFEIELDGVSSKDVSFTFGGAYIRYGNPTLVDFAGGVLVRYESQYDSARQAFTATTLIPPAMTPTAGHSCWTGGSPGYATSGCEHFGLGLVRNPTARRPKGVWRIREHCRAGVDSGPGSGGSRSGRDSRH